MERARIAAVTATIVFALVSPVAVFAQASTDQQLSGTIRAQLLSDPRTATLSQAQLDAMVQLLSQRAQEQGITSNDLQWQPQTFADAPQPQTAAATPVCDGSYTCLLDEAFGFVGSKTIIPFTLGAASMALIWILAEMMHRRGHHPLAGPIKAPTSSGM